MVSLTYDNECNTKILAISQDVPPSFILMVIEKKKTLFAIMNRVCWYSHKLHGFNWITMQHLLIMLGFCRRSGIISWDSKRIFTCIACVWRKFRACCSGAWCSLFSWSKGAWPYLHPIGGDLNDFELSEGGCVSFLRYRLNWLADTDASDFSSGPSHPSFQKNIFTTRLNTKSAQFEACEISTGKRGD